MFVPNPHTLLDDDDDEELEQLSLDIDMDEEEDDIAVRVPVPNGNHGNHGNHHNDDSDGATEDRRSVDNRTSKSNDSGAVSEFLRTIEKWSFFYPTTTASATATATVNGNGNGNGNVSANLDASASANVHSNTIGIAIDHPSVSPARATHARTASGQLPPLPPGGSDPTRHRQRQRDSSGRNININMNSKSNSNHQLQYSGGWNSNPTTDPSANHAQNAQNANANVSRLLFENDSFDAVPFNGDTDTDPLGLQQQEEWIEYHPHDELDRDQRTQEEILTSMTIEIPTKHAIPVGVGARSRTFGSNGSIPNNSNHHHHHYLSDDQGSNLSPIGNVSSIHGPSVTDAHGDDDGQSDDDLDRILGAVATNNATAAADADAATNRANSAAPSTQNNGSGNGNVNTHKFFNGSKNHHHHQLGHSGNSSSPFDEPPPQPPAAIKPQQQPDARLMMSQFAKPIDLNRTLETGYSTEESDGNNTPFSSRNNSSSSNNNSNCNGFLASLDHHKVASNITAAASEEGNGILNRGLWTIHGAATATTTTAATDKEQQQQQQQQSPKLESTDDDCWALPWQHDPVEEGVEIDAEAALAQLRETKPNRLVVLWQKLFGGSKQNSGGESESRNGSSQSSEMGVGHKSRIKKRSRKNLLWLLLCLVLLVVLGVLLGLWLRNAGVDSPSGAMSFRGSTSSGSGSDPTNVQQEQEQPQQESAIPLRSPSASPIALEGTAEEPSASFADSIPSQLPVSQPPAMGTGTSTPVMSSEWRDHPPLWSSPAYRPSVFVGGASGARSPSLSSLDENSNDYDYEPPTNLALTAAPTPALFPSQRGGGGGSPTEASFLYDDEEGWENINVNGNSNDYDDGATVTSNGDIKLTMGPLVGHTTHESTTIWAYYQIPTRYLAEERFRLKAELFQYYKADNDDAPSVPVSSASGGGSFRWVGTIENALPDPERNNAVFATFKDLEPLTAYRYELSILGKTVGRGSFRTAPEPPEYYYAHSNSNNSNDPPEESNVNDHYDDDDDDDHYPGVRFDYVLASCMDRTEHPVQPAWDEIAYIHYDEHGNDSGSDASTASKPYRRYPDFAILAGDTVYMKMNIDVDYDRMGVRFDRLWNRNEMQRIEPHFARFIRNTPTYATWNNHDYGAELSDAHQLGKELSLRAFRSLWPSPHPLGGRNSSTGSSASSANGDGIGSDVDSGNESRGIYYSFYRGDVHFIVTDDHWYRDPTVGNRFGSEQTAWIRSELLDSRGTFKIIVVGSDIMQRAWSSDLINIGTIVRNHKINGVLFHSGDIHRNEYKRAETGGFPYPVTQITSSGIAKVWRRPFVHVAVDTTLRDDPVLTARFYGASTVELSDSTVWTNDPNLRCSSIQEMNRDQEHSCTETIRLSDLTVAE